MTRPIRSKNGKPGKRVEFWSAKDWSLEYMGCEEVVSVTQTRQIMELNDPQTAEGGPSRSCAAFYFVGQFSCIIQKIGNLSTIYLQNSRIKVER